MKRAVVCLTLSVGVLVAVAGCQPLKVDPARFDFARLDAPARDVVVTTRAAIRDDPHLTLHQQAGPAELPDGVVRTIVVAKTPAGSLLRITIDEGGEQLEKGRSSLVIEGETPVLREYGDPLLRSIQTRLGG